jgi:hypothetical protein
MKKLVITLIAVAGLSASVFAQGTITADNVNGIGGPTATSRGLFFNSSGQAYTGPTVNMTILGGTSAGSLQPVANLTGGSALVSFGGGIYADPAGATYSVPNVPLSGTATLQVQAWIGASPTYASANPLGEQFFAWSGSASVPGNAFTFENPTGGGGTPAALPKSLDGMPAMSLQPIPEPSTFALAGLGMAALLFFRRRN